MGLPTDPLSHAGLTVAVVFILEFSLRHIAALWARRKRQASGPNRFSNLRQENSQAGEVGGWAIDYRLVIIGSLLPDLLDKSFGIWFVPEVLNSTGRLFGHTILFNFLLLGVSLLTTIMVRFARSLSLLVFSLASAGHLLMDRMWESPETLFWPLYGLRFGGAEFNLSPDWIQWIQRGNGPMVVDGTGALVLALFAVWLYRRGTLLRWLRTGQA